MTEKTAMPAVGIAHASEIAILTEAIMQTAGENWRALSEAASRERDPERLIELIEELNRVLVHRELELRRRLLTN